MDGFDFDDENDDDLHSEDLGDIVEPEEEYREGPDYTIGRKSVAARSILLISPRFVTTSTIMTTTIE